MRNSLTFDLIKTDNESENDSYTDRVLKHREVPDLEDFFDHDWEIVQSPFNLDYMKEAVDLFLFHIKKKHHIAILVDVDVDGLTSAAALIGYIDSQKMYGDWSKEIKVTHLIHKEKIHGLDDKDAMRALRDEIMPDLLVIPDASGTAEQYAALRELDIDILVLDHHDTDERGNGDNIVVVNNQHSDNYTNKELSGVGVVYQFLRALDEQTTFTCSSDALGLVALGLTADVMSLKSPETRFLILEGLKNDYLENPFLEAVLEKDAYRLQDKLNPHKVAFNIAPMLNAVQRIGTLGEREIVLQAMIPLQGEQGIQDGTRGAAKGKMVPLAFEAVRQATNTKSRQDRRKEKLTEKIDDLITEERLFDNKVIIVNIDEFDDEQRSMSGLIAQNIAENYNRPAILVFKQPNGNYAGSVRAPDNIKAFAQFRIQCEDSGYVIYASGHNQAFGIALTADNIPKLLQYFNIKYSEIEINNSYKVDFCMNADDPELTDLIMEIGAHEFWGKGVEEPLIAVQKVKVDRTNLQLMKRNTMKIKNGDISFIKFFATPEEVDSLKLPVDGDASQYYELTIIGTASVNRWAGQEYPQILITDYRIDKAGYDF